MVHLMIGVSALAVITGLTTTSSSAQTTDAPSATSLDQVIVTARKREESLQDVPISVTAFSTKAFEQQHIENLQDLRFVVPNLSVTPNQGTSNGAQIYIRGIGQDDQTITAEGGIGVYLDGVYLGSAIGALQDIGDFERIEVLRGPQGTLYGRNTTAGAVKFVSRRPSLTDYRAVGDVTAGSYNLVQLHGSISAPIIKDVLGGGNRVQQQQPTRVRQGPRPE